MLEPQEWAILYISDSRQHSFLKVQSQHKQQNTRVRAKEQIRYGVKFVLCYKAMELVHFRSKYKRKRDLTLAN